MPVPSSAAAIVPATCVPCDDVVGAQAAWLGSGLPVTQPADADLSSSLARFGWAGSIPESSTPTSTRELPSLIRCALSALIIDMSHCRPVRSPADAMSGAGLLPL